MSSSSSGVAARIFNTQDSRQRLVDQLINSISQPQDIDQIKDLLEQLDIEDVDELHSITRLSALETLCSLYPLLKEIHLEILELLLEKGARLDKVEEGILRRMMDMELETRTSIVKEFEDKLIQKFNEIDEKKEDTSNEVITNQAQNNERSSSLTPLTDSSPSPSPAHHRKVSADNAHSPSLRSLRWIPVSQTHSAPYRPRREHSPASTTHGLAQSPSPPPNSAARSRPLNPQNAGSPPFLPPRPPPLTRSARDEHLGPSQFIRLHVALPLHTSFISLASYFSEVLQVQISSVSLFVEYEPAHAFFDVDRQDWDNHYLPRRIQQVEDGELVPFRDPNGRIFRLEPNVARAARPRQLPPPRGEFGGAANWIEAVLKGLSAETTTQDVEGFLSTILKYWKDLKVIRTYSKNFRTELRSGKEECAVEVMFKVQGEKAFKVVERDFGRTLFQGRVIQVYRAEDEDSKRRSEMDERGRPDSRKRGYDENLDYRRNRDSFIEGNDRYRQMDRDGDGRKATGREDSQVRTRRTRDSSRDRDSRERRRRRRSRSRTRSRSRSRTRRHRDGSYGRRNSGRRHRREEEEEEEEEEDYSRHGKSERRRSRSPDRSRHRHRRSHRSPSPIGYDNGRESSRSLSYDRPSFHRRSFSNKNSQSLYPPPLPERYSPSSFDYSRQSHFDSFNSSNSRHLPPSNETSLSNYLENRFASTPIYSIYHPPADPSRNASNLPPTFTPLNTPPPSLLQRIEPQLFKPVPTRPWQVSTFETHATQQLQATLANTQGLGVGSGTGKWSSNAWEQVDREKIEREKKEREREWKYWEERSKGTIDGNGKGRYERRYW